VGRWMSVDPMADCSREWSPFVYASCNPMCRLDPNGMRDTTIDGQEAPNVQEEVVTTGMRDPNYVGGRLTPVQKAMYVVDILVYLGQNNPTLFRARPDGEIYWYRRRSDISIGVVNFPFLAGPRRLAVPGFVKNAGSFVGWLKEIERPALKLSKQEVDDLVKLAREYGVRVEEPVAGHPGTQWDMPHIHVGTPRVHIPVPEGYKLP
jgi:hypothetical protein